MTPDGTSYQDVGSWIEMAAGRAYLFADVYDEQRQTLGIVTYTGKVVAIAAITSRAERNWNVAFEYGGKQWIGNGPGPGCYVKAKVQK